MKKTIAMLMIFSVIFCTLPVTSFAVESVTAYATTSRVTVDGADVGFDAYQINQSNYFKLRDIAYVLSGTNSQFAVTWDSKNHAINLITGNTYIATGEEFTNYFASKNVMASKSDAQIYIDGERAVLDAYTIDGNNYFKLRDLGGCLGFSVDWDLQTNTIAIGTDVQPQTYATNADSTKAKKVDYHWEYPIDWFEWDYSLNIPVAAYEAYKSVDRENIYGYTEYISEESDDEYLALLTQKFVDAGDESGFEDIDTIYLIITFVQSLNYMSDYETTGYDEYPKYPLETLYDKGGDCEDMSILLASLLTELGYGTALICFDDHMGVGIKGSDDLPGYYFEKYGTRYYYIETTSPGWSIGEIPDEYIDDQALLLFF